MHYEQFWTGELAGVIPRVLSVSSFDSVSYKLPVIAEFIDSKRAA